MSLERSNADREWMIPAVAHGVKGENYGTKTSCHQPTDRLHVSHQPHPPLDVGNLVRGHCVRRRSWSGRQLGSGVVNR